jgi:hypothetical protein
VLANKLPPPQKKSSHTQNIHNPELLAVVLFCFMANSQSLHVTWRHHEHSRFFFNLIVFSDGVRLTAFFFFFRFEEVVGLKFPEEGAIDIVNYTKHFLKRGS